MLKRFAAIAAAGVLSLSPASSQAAAPAVAAPTIKDAVDFLIGNLPDHSYIYFSDETELRYENLKFEKLAIRENEPCKLAASIGSEDHPGMVTALDFRKIDSIRDAGYSTADNYYKPFSSAVIIQGDFVVGTVPKHWIQHSAFIFLSTAQMRDRVSRAMDMLIKHCKVAEPI